MIEFHEIIPAAVEVTIASVPTLTTEGARYAGKTKDFLGYLRDSIRYDSRLDDSSSFARRVKAIGFTTAIGSEITIGNETLVTGFGFYYYNLADRLISASNSVVDTGAKTAIVIGGVGGFSYMQQRGYGKIAQSAAAKYPSVIETMSSLNNEKALVINDDSAADGNIAPLVGTTLSFVSHKSKNPESTKEQEDEVIKRGAKLIAGTWAAAFGVAAAVANGSDKIEDSPVFQAIASVKNPAVLLPVIGGTIIAKEWLGLIKSKLVSNRSTNSETVPLKER